MAHRVPTDEELLTSGDPASFEAFYGRHVEAVLGFFARRTRDAELAADLTAETFAAALAGRRRFRPAAGAGGAWLYGIAMNKLADAQRRGFAERRARRRMGMERIELHEDDVLAIEALGTATTATALLQVLPDDQRAAISAHVLRGVPYRDIAAAQHVSEAAVRKRVSRGLAALRERIGTRR